MPRHYTRKPIQERFENHIFMEPMSGCWLWMAAISKKNYALFTVQRGIKQLGHRASWEIYKGPIPKGMKVLHKCDTPPCVNPEHLFLGTMADNTHDACNKGRMGPGEKDGNAKLTNQKVIEIRKDGRNQSAIAKDYGITRQNISSIKCRKSWKHI